MLKEIKDFLKAHFPFITRKEYYQDIDDLLVTISALTHSEKQHAQLEMSIIQNMSKLSNGAIKKEDIKKESKDVGSDPSYY